jgi:ornithine carbamoyltransferase
MTLKSGTPQMLGRTGIEQIIMTAKSITETGFGDVSSKINSPFVIGSLFYGASTWDSRIADLTAARLGCSYIDFPTEERRAMSSEETISQLKDVSRSVDILLAAYVDTDSFGAGHLLATRFSAVTKSPLICVRDEVFAHQPGLAELLGFSLATQGLEKRKIVISWGFGSQFVLPSTAHSLLILALTMGSSVRVVSPPRFPLLKRAIREARDIAKSNGSEFEETQEFEGSFRDAEAVFALNWCRLDDLNHPERFAAYAAEFKDWHFASGALPDGCVFSSEYPIETDVLAASTIARGNDSVASSWLARRVSVLAASIDWVLHRKGNVDPNALV